METHDVRNEAKVAAEMKALKFQNLLIIITLLLSLPGVWISYATLRDQQRINSQQANLNDLAQDRYDRRYSSKVALGADRFASSLDCFRVSPEERHDYDACWSTVTVYNRAPVPLRAVYALSGVGRDVDNLGPPMPASRPLGPPLLERSVDSLIFFNDIPPCTSIAVKAYIWTEPHILIFKDGTASWFIDTDGLSVETKYRYWYSEYYGGIGINETVFVPSFSEQAADSKAAVSPLGDCNEGS